MRLDKVNNSELQHVPQSHRRENLASEQLRILRHMLGIDDPYMREPRPWRDYYCANPGDPEMRALAEAGAVMLYDTRGGYEWWRCTEAGRAAAIESHGTIQHSKCQSDLQEVPGSERLPP